MDETEVHRDNWPFKAKEKSGKPVINVQFKSEDEEFVSFVLTTTFVVENMLMLQFTDSREGFRNDPWQDEGDC